MMHYIYALKDDDTYLYVGRTIHPSVRECGHRSRKDKSCGSSSIPKDINWKFVILDECEDTEEAEWTEKLLIDFFEPPYNKVRPRVNSRDYAGIMEQPQFAHRYVPHLPRASTPTRH
jgi:predicted GIY-YIG superfamily endonuclease